MVIKWSLSNHFNEINNIDFLNDCFIAELGHCYVDRQLIIYKKEHDFNNINHNYLAHM